MSGYIGEDLYLSTTFGKSLSLRVDGGFNAVSINPSGRDVVLASRRGLYVVDLDDPFSPPRWLHHRTSWEVADVQWSPHPAKPYWVVSTSNQKAMVWNLSRNSTNAIEHILHGHFRAITDINFHPHHPEILATCSVDTYVLAWDMRSPQRPYYSTSEWRAGASQVKWNFQNSNIMASSHSDHVCIWDLRKGCTPLYTLQGHEGSVNNIDFNKAKETEIMSSSNDGTVKFWDYSVSDTKPKHTIVTDFPVWRGRYLPFGEGSCIMPIIGGNNSLYLVNNDGHGENEKTSRMQPVYIFKGHTDRVTDFLWRSRHGYNTDVDDREFQLVTWSKDCDLRLWPMIESTYEKVNFERGKKLEEKLPNYEYVSYRRDPEKTEHDIEKFRRIKETFVTKSGLGCSDAKKKFNHLAWVSGVKMNHSDSAHDFFEETTLQNLGEEVSAVGHKFPKIVFEKISVSTGTLVLTLNGPWAEEDQDDYIFLRIEIRFPAKYPESNNAPIFMIEENRELTNAKKQEMMKTLKEIGKKYTNLGKYCLEPCLRFILGEKVNLNVLNDEDEQVLNFDIADHVDFDDYSSLASSEDDSKLNSSVSSDSESEDITETEIKGSEAMPNTRSRSDMAFDSTPVPKRCGAVWTPTGHLLCFFISGTKPERKQQNILKLGQRGFSGLRKSKTNNPEIIYDEKSKEEVEVIKPKRYVDTLSRSSQYNSEMDNTENETNSDASSDSFSDDWDDILKNDITLRTKMPAILNNFKSTLATIPSDTARTTDSLKKTKNVVVVHDFRHLIPDKRELAIEYRLMGETPEVLAKYNAAVAEKYGYEEISHCWKMLANLLIARDEKNFYNFGWDQHPLGGRWFLKEVIEYFEKSKNVQMLAMLCCLLVEPGKPQNVYTTRKKKSKGSENVITFHNDYYGSPYLQESSTFSNDFLSSSNNSLDLGISHVKLKYNNSLAIANTLESGSVKSEDYFTSNHNGSKPHRLRSASAAPYNDSPIQATPDIKIEIIHDDILDLVQDSVPSLLDPADEAKFRSYRRQYAELLYYWGLAISRVKVLKFNINANTERSLLEDIEHGTDNEDHVYRGIMATWLKDSKGRPVSQNCSYCGLKADRIFVCGNCQHIMHASCASEWWAIADECPTGCGCCCPLMFDVS